MLVFEEGIIKINQIEVVSYNSDWPKEFAIEAARVREALGDNYLEIHHVGSTAVLQLAAKPIIDMLPVVKDIYAVDRCLNAMQALGYEAKGEFGIPFRRYFQYRKNSKAYNIHIFEQANPEIERHLKFRDWLRDSPKDRNAYAELKQNLAQKFPKDIMSYCLGKEEFITNIITNKIGWNDLSIVMVFTPKEWQEYHRIRIEQIFNSINIIYDENHPSLTLDNHYHFVLYKGENIVSVVHVEFLNEHEAAIRSLATDEPYKRNGYGSYIMHLIERWIKGRGSDTIKIHAAFEAEHFYRSLGYRDMEFDDISISKEVIDLGKII